MTKEEMKDWISGMDAAINHIIEVAERRSNIPKYYIFDGVEEGDDGGVRINYRDYEGRNSDSVHVSLDDILDGLGQ